MELKIDYQKQAKHIVRNYIDLHLSLEGQPRKIYQIYLVWFCVVETDWKAVLGTTLNDGMYYELTHSGERKETLLEAYLHVDTLVVGPSGNSPIVML